MAIWWWIEHDQASCSLNCAKIGTHIFALSFVVISPWQLPSGQNQPALLNKDETSIKCELWLSTFMASHLTLRLFENEIYEQSHELYHITNFMAALVELFPCCSLGTHWKEEDGGETLRPWCVAISRGNSSVISDSFAMLGRAQICEWKAVLLSPSI